MFSMKWVGLFIRLMYFFQLFYGVVNGKVKTEGRDERNEENKREGGCVCSEVWNSVKYERVCERG